MRSSAMSYSVATLSDLSEMRERGRDLQATAFGHEDIFSRGENRIGISYGYSVFLDAIEALGAIAPFLPTLARSGRWREQFVPTRRSRSCSDAARRIRIPPPDAVC
jgi:hypothetical protein